MNSPELAKALHKAVKVAADVVADVTDGLSVGSTDPSVSRRLSVAAYDHYEVYKKYLQNRPVTALRDLLDLGSERSPISIEGSGVGE